MPISTKAVLYLRKQDKMLPTDVEYADPRILEIAKRMKALVEEMENLDLKLVEIELE